MRFQEFVQDQVFSPSLIADGLRTTKSEIAGTLGLGKDAFTRASRVRARKTQVRLRQMLEILNRVETATGSPLAAYAWFRAEPLPGFGGATPDLLVREGKADQVACLSGPHHGRRLCLSLRSPDAVPSAGVPVSQSTVVLDANFR